MFALYSPCNLKCMASVDIFIPNRIYKNGTTPIFLQFIVDRAKYKKLILAVEPEHIDEKNKEIKRSHPNAARMNQIIHKRLSGAKAYILDCQFNDEPVNPHQFFSVPVGETIIEHLKAREESLREQGQFRRSYAFRNVAGNIEKAKLDIKIKVLDIKWVERFNTYMLGRGLSPGTRGLYLSVLNTLFKRLIDQGVMKRNPMLDYKIPSGKSSGNKEKYTLDEFNIIRTMPLKKIVDHWARQMWVFATLARGMRAYDVLTLKWSNIKDGRLKYTASKSKKDFNIQITPDMQACLEGLPKNKEYVFPFVKMPSSMLKKDKEAYEAHVNAVNSSINESKLARIQKLSGINKHLTMHVARHTYSYIQKKSGMDMELLQKTLGHADMKTTIVYTGELIKEEILDEAVKGGFG